MAQLITTLSTHAKAWISKISEREHTENSNEINAKEIIITGRRGLLLFSLLVNPHTEGKSPHVW